MVSLNGVEIPATRWERLERTFQDLAGCEGSVYLPNVRPMTKVDVIVVAMEPSLGPWARDRQTAEDRIRNGFRNFMWSMRDFVVQCVLTQRLGEPGRGYHLTDLSKGAMLVSQASSRRRARYDRWFEALREEVELVSHPGTKTKIVALGNTVQRYLDGRLDELAVNPPLIRLPHYSGQAAAYHLLRAEAHPEGFEAFARSFTKDNVLAYAEARMTELGVADELKQNILVRRRHSDFGRATQAMAFIYSQAFDRGSGGYAN